LTIGCTRFSRIVLIHCLQRLIKLNPQSRPQELGAGWHELARDGRGKFLANPWAQFAAAELRGIDNDAVEAA
jgi:hypothetical protein